MIRALLIGLTNAYSTIIIVYVLMSWFPHTTGILADIYRTLGKICDPYLNLFKRFIPPIGGMVDISPILALLVLQLIVRFIVGIL